MKVFKYRISRNALSTSYHGFIHPVIKYGDLLYTAAPRSWAFPVEGNNYNF
jgi:hypothetical protein